MGLVSKLFRSFLWGRSILLCDPEYKGESSPTLPATYLAVSILSADRLVPKLSNCPVDDLWGGDDVFEE